MSALPKSTPEDVHKSRTSSVIVKIPLGLDEDGNTVFWKVSEYSLNLAITGRPGSGKSFFLGNLMKTITSTGLGKVFLLDWYALDRDDSEQTLGEQASKRLEWIIEEIATNPSSDQPIFLVFDSVPLGGLGEPAMIENHRFHRKLEWLLRIGRSRNVHMIFAGNSIEDFPRTWVASTRAELRFRQHSDQPNEYPTHTLRTGEKIYLDYSTTAIPEARVLSS